MKLIVSEHAWKRLNYRMPEHKFKTKGDFNAYLLQNLSKKTSSILAKLPDGKEKVIRIERNFYPIIRKGDNYIIKSYIPKFLMTENAEELKNRIEELQKIIASHRGRIRTLEKQRGLLSKLKPFYNKWSGIFLYKIKRIIKK
jgi:hypothetical protein